MQGAQPTQSPSTLGSAGAPLQGRGSAAAYPRSYWWYFKWFFITLQLVVFCAIVVTLTAGYGIYQQLSKIMPDVNFITSRNKAEATRVYAADNTLLAEFKGEQRRFVPISDLKVTRQWGHQQVVVPGRLIDATLAIEDKRFYQHPGMDLKRIAGAAFANMRSRDSTSQGGSTITEQLAVNIYLKRTKTLARRLQTALLALQLEKRFTKDEILELYLNEIYYGNRAYGCEAASETYFNKPARDLSIAEAALLAGLPNSPSYLDPFDHFDHAIKRQALVLKELFIDKKLNWGQYQTALNDTSLEGEVHNAKRHVMASRRDTQHWRAPYFVSYVKNYLQKQYGWSDEFLYNGGLKIYTTLDPMMQNAAETSMRQHLDDLGRPQLQGAMVCIDPWTGHVVAMVGGRDYYDTKHGGEWNRAVQSKRQCGSSFKPYVYATAMEAGYNPDSIVIDKKLVIFKHEIRNDDRINRGALTFREALGISDNVAAVRVLLQVGIQNVIQKAHLMGIESSLVPVPTLALGTSEISLLEHTSAYGVFATNGLRAEETPIERVDNYAGTTLVEHEHPVHGARVLSEPAAGAMWKMLRYVVTDGTGRRAQIDGVDVVGKTGTTSSNKDVWFMGATKQLVCGVWMGYDRPRDLEGNSAGGKWCAPAWRSFMVRALDIWSKHDNVAKLVEDARATDQRRLMASQYKKIIQVRICNESGLLANAGCPSTRVVELSSAEGVPTQHCNIPAHMSRAQRSQALGEGGDSGNLGGAAATPDGSLGDSSGTPNSGAQGDDEQPANPNVDNYGNDGTQGNSGGADSSPAPSRATARSDNGDSGVVRHAQAPHGARRGSPAADAGADSGGSAVPAPDGTATDNSVDNGAPRVLNDDGGEINTQ